MAFAQLTYRESLRDIETCLGAVGGQAVPHGFSQQCGAFDAFDQVESHVVLLRFIVAGVAVLASVLAKRHAMAKSDTRVRSP
jgi:hypothetical protein